MKIKRCYQNEKVFLKCCSAHVRSHHHLAIRSVPSQSTTPAKASSLYLLFCSDEVLKHVQDNTLNSFLGLFENQCETAKTHILISIKMSSKEKRFYQLIHPQFFFLHSPHQLSDNEAESHRDVKLIVIKKVTFHCDLLRSVKVGPEGTMDKSYIQKQIFSSCFSVGKEGGKLIYNLADCRNKYSKFSCQVQNKHFPSHAKK